ncbi:hypothetical protein DFP94_102492 [Fontibacillus phaseoli]|uniref:Prenyltransferase/squalene oxidase-like repeat protein n=1 Tax=Fontibacillus phaseoli TaxID=1416533 RepID=A0A369BKS6_9BACL|nr:hypothetical protein [Fontibacillus phaseoli]RCX21735.1 hypothetical protein DFP94_102492 [Fontibacillus phaseoli]
MTISQKQSEVLEQGRKFIYGSARLLDRMRFAFHFENGDKEQVLNALRPYQNTDGGFGNALEPDMRCPQSQPVTTETALMVIKEVEGWDSDLMNGMLTYLKGITLDMGGFPRAATSVNDYPHAPWWTTEQDGVPSLNPTGSIIGMLLGQQARQDFLNEDWFVKNVAFLWECFEKSLPGDYHDAVQWMSFLANAAPEPDDRGTKFEAALDDWLAGPNGIEKNPHAEGYVHKVLDYAPAPNSYASRLITSEELELHLDWMIGNQQEDGGWDIPFPAVSVAGHQEWRGWLTVENLKTLRAYGRI